MSRRNVDLVHRSFEAFANGGFEVAFSNYSADAEWLTATDEPDPRTYRGVAGIREFVASAGEPWVDRFENKMNFEDFIDCGDWVVVPWTAELQGRGSGISIDVSETYAVHVQGEKIVRVEEYRTREQALEAVRRRPTSA